MCFFGCVPGLVAVELETGLHPREVALAHHFLDDVAFEAEIAGLRAFDEVIQVEDEDVGGEGDDDGHVGEPVEAECVGGAPERLGVALDMHSMPG